MHKSFPKLSDVDSGSMSRLIPSKTFSPRGFAISLISTEPCSFSGVGPLGSFLEHSMEEGVGSFWLGLIPVVFSSYWPQI